ncbi:SH3 domain-binding glutamic acid-rich -like protein [Trichinella murrelli]|uniref:SH3 domain-binding glutamic acid-rich-like protein n=1 Tax=Trichinella murrelli TaxID=144512 RepID=A0A0V0TIG9_9BILA|nr:SH3 domain-binding glutamic acid-rich -like protein [Trichinella murrelli]
MKRKCQFCILEKGYEFGQAQSKNSTRELQGRAFRIPPYCPKSATRCCFKCKRLLRRSAVTESYGTESAFKKHTQHVIMVLDAMRVSYELFDLCDSRDCNKKEKYKEVCASKRNGQLWFPQIFFGEDYCGDYDDFAEAIESNKLNTFLKLAPAETSAINEQEVGVKNVGEDDEAKDSDKPSATTASNGHDDDDDGDVVDEETENKVEEDSESLQKSTHEVSADDSDANFDRGVSSEALEEEVNNEESDKLENTTDENDDEDDESKSDEKSIQGEEEEEEEEEEEKEEGEEEEPEENGEEEKKDDDEEEDSEQQQEQEEVNDKAEKEAEKEELDNITEEEEAEAEDELEVEDDEERSDSE